jgi:branched-chain amino acid transport system permease protein
MIFIQQLLNGLMLGCTYVLVALGFTLIFGLLRLVHLAHGQVLMVGAYIGLVMISYLGMNIVTSIAATALATGMLGILIYYASIRKVEKGSFLAPLVSTIGVAIILQEIVTKLFTGEKSAFPETVVSQNVNLGFIAFNAAQPFIIIFSFLFMFIIYYIIKRTMVGKSIRALSENSDTARLLGVPVTKIVVVTVGMASILAGIGGILVGTAYHAIYPLMGVEIGLKGLAIIVIGGMGNVVGAMVSGLIVGLMEVFSVAYISAAYKDAFAYGLMMIILIWKPEGLFGTVAGKK